MIKLSKDIIVDIAGNLECGQTCYLNLDTGEVKRIFNTDDEFGEAEFDYIEENWPDYTEISPPASRESFGIMRDFVDTVIEGKFKTSLIQALNGRKPFANFKDHLFYDEKERQNYFEFKKQAFIDHVIFELEKEEGVEVEKFETQ